MSLTLEDRDLVHAIETYELARDARDRAVATDDQQEMTRLRNVAIDLVRDLLRGRLNGQGLGFFEWRGVRWSVDRYGEVSYHPYRPAHKDRPFKPRKGGSVLGEPRAREIGSREFRYEH